MKRWVWVLIFTSFAGLAWAQEDWRSRGILLSEARLGTLQTRIDERVEPTYSAWLALKAECDANVGREPQPTTTWLVPPRYDDPTGHDEAIGSFGDDSRYAYKLALCYRMTGEEPYAAAAARIIDAWATTLEVFPDDSYNEQSKLSFSTRFPPMIYAADLLEGSSAWTDAHRETFRNFVREAALPMTSIAFTRGNNWGNRGLVLLLASAAYLDDRERFDEGVQRWKFFVHSQIGPEGEMWFEVRRNESTGDRGISYSHSALFAQTVAAEILRVNGQDLYDWASPNGNTLRRAFETIAAWTRRPEAFPFYEGDPSQMRGNPRRVSYFEVLNARWPNEDAASVLLQERPLDEDVVAPNMTFTHGEPLSTR